MEKVKAARGMEFQILFVCWRRWEKKRDMIPKNESTMKYEVNKEWCSTLEQCNGYNLFFLRLQIEILLTLNVFQTIFMSFSLSLSLSVGLPLFLLVCHNFFKCLFILIDYFLVILPFYRSFRSVHPSLYSSHKCLILGLVGFSDIILNLYLCRQTDGWK